MLTMLKRLASLVPTPATNKVTLFVSDTGIPSYKDDTGLVTPMSGQPIPAGYIDGLKMEWVSGTQIRFTSGSAYIPSLGRALALAAAVTKTPTLAANTWYHNYVYDNAGSTDVEVSTTVPAAPYNGTARAKTGDSSRRYIGSFRTDGTGAIISFLHEGRKIIYRNSWAPSNRFLSGGTSTTPVVVSAAAFASPISRMLALMAQATSTNASYSLSTPDDVTGTYAQVINIETAPAGGTFTIVTDFPLGTAQQLQYSFGSTPNGAAFLNACGYYFDR